VNTQLDGEFILPSGSSFIIPPQNTNN